MDRSKIVILHEEGCSERQISDKLKLGKTAIHQPVARVKTFGSYQDLSRTCRPKVANQRDDDMIKKMVVHSPTTLSKNI